jgi:hypothetical protein
MKTTIEMHGFEIVIEETEAGLLTVSAMKDGDVVEEFSLETGEQDLEGDDDDIKGFDQFGDEEEDFEGEESDDDDMEDMEDMEDMGDDDDDVEDVEDEEEYEGEEDDSKLESFQSFINSKKRK